MNQEDIDVNMGNGAFSNNPHSVFIIKNDENGKNKNKKPGHKSIILCLALLVIAGGIGVFSFNEYRMIRDLQDSLQEKEKTISNLTSEKKKIIKKNQEYKSELEDKNARIEELENTVDSLSQNGAETNYSLSADPSDEEKQPDNSSASNLSVEGSIEVKSEQYLIKYTKCEQCTTYDGKDAVRVYFEYTNYSDQPKRYYDYAWIAALLDDVEEIESYASDYIDSDFTSANQIRNGKTMEFTMIYPKAPGQTLEVMMHKQGDPNYQSIVIR